MTMHLTALLVMEERRRDSVYPADVLDRIGTMVEWAGPAMTREQLSAQPELLDTVDVLFSGWGAPVLDAPLLARAPRLRHVLVAAGSIRSITTDAMWEREISIVSAAAANAKPVAEFALAHILLGLKQTYRVTRQIQAQRCYPDKVGVSGAYGAQVGILSLGEIGRLVAAHLAHFDVAVSAYDPFAAPDLASSSGVRLATLNEVFATSDVVSIHTPLLPETEGLIDGRLLESMKHGATVINTARGAVVNEPELVDVLTRRPDLTAVLDVTWPEPPPRDSPLFELPNVQLTGHLAGAHGMECARMGELVAEELERLTVGLPLLHAVDRATAATRA